MRIIFILAMLQGIFLGCNTSEPKGYNVPYEKGCTLKGGVTSIEVNITSADPLPPNLAIALNGEKVDVDECNPGEESVPNIIRFDNDRTHATIYFYPYESPEDFELYFPNGSNGPKTNLIDLIFYSRANCADPHIQFQEISNNNGISWLPGFANGEDCGVTGYNGVSHIHL